MTLTQADMETIGNIVEKAMERTLREKAVCCPLEPIAGHFAGLLDDMGDGNGDRGLRALRDNNQWIKDVRTRTERYGASVILATIGLLTVTLVGGMLALVGNWLRGGG
ncbi:MAG: hypothetical protein QMD09_04180 [Desulfatibacillaceae bacterium]|nr:hypothetical protein [Desulfatibacillaceae bacterium]